jgi:hypothetical protein
VALLAGYDTDSQSARRAGRYPPHLIRVNSMSHDKLLKRKTLCIRNVRVTLPRKDFRLCTRRTLL